MKLEILQIPDCPNVPVLVERIRQATAGQALDVEITHRVIDDQATASVAGMTGSPTLLVAGHDPFATPGQVPGVSCRLYRTEAGGIDGSPSVAALRAALGLEPPPIAAADPQATADCCAPSAGIGGWRGAARPGRPGRAGGPPRDPARLRRSRSGADSRGPHRCRCRVRPLRRTRPRPSARLRRDPARPLREHRIRVPHLGNAAPCSNRQWRNHGFVVANHGGSFRERFSIYPLGYMGPGVIPHSAILCM